MSIQHYAVEEILRQLPSNIQSTVNSALDDWENTNKALTRAILAGLHRVPPPVKDVLGKYTPAWLLLKPASYLEWCIIQLAENAARKGTLTEENRRDFEKFISYKSVSLPKSSKGSKRK